MAVGSERRVRRGEPVDGRLGDTHQHLRGKRGCLIVRMPADHRAPDHANGLTDAADLVADGAADETADEHAARAPSRLELAGREDLIIDPPSRQCFLHEADHLGF